MYFREPTNYLASVQKTIARKKFKLLKRSFTEGKKEADQLFKPFVDIFQNGVKNIQHAKVECIARNAQKLIEDTLEKNPLVIIPMVLKLFKNIAEHTDVELTAHHKDAKIIKDHLHEISMACVSARKIIIIEDETFKRGSLVIKANKSIIDAHITTQITKAKEILLENLSS